MKMKKLFLLFVLAGAMPLTMMAQDDDLYFTPSKKAVKTSSSVNHKPEKPTYYVGSNRDVDEYNRHGKFRSTYQKIGVDSLGNDIIEFQAGTGIYPDTSYVDTMWVSPKKKYQDDEDYAYSRRMSRWDGYYGWYDPWYYRHWGPWGYYGWYDPWYYGWYGYPWYYGWGPYDPWYYGYYGYYGWYDPWYYGYYGGGGYSHHSTGYSSGHTGSLGYYDRSHYGNNTHVGRGITSNSSGTGSFTRNGVTYGSGNKGLGSRRPISVNTRRSTSSSTPSSTFSNPSPSSSYGGHSSFGSSSSSSGSSFGGSSSSSSGGSFSGGGSRSSGGGGHVGGRR